MAPDSSGATAAAEVTLAAAPSPMFLYSTKGQKPWIGRAVRSGGYSTGRAHLCIGCRQLGGTLAVLVKDKKNHITIYTHPQCRANGSALQGMQRLIEAADQMAKEAA